jgi:hypothetical protein
LLEEHLDSGHRFYKLFVGLGVVLSIIHLSHFVISPEMLSSDLIKARDEAGPGFLMVPISLALVLFGTRFYLGKKLKSCPIYIVCLFPLMASFILSFSRTAWIIAIVLFLSLAGAINKVNLRSLTTGLLLVSAVIVSILITSSIEGSDVTMGRKTLQVITEILPSDYSSEEDINIYWRGFETYKALQQYMLGTPLQLIIGQGAGARVELGFVMNLAGSDYTSIPVLHNGYSYVLVKTGLVGIILCILFFYKILKCGSMYSFSVNKSLMFQGRFLMGCVWSIIITTLVIGGLYQQADIAPYMILIGYFYHHFQRFSGLNKAQSFRGVIK